MKEAFRPLFQSYKLNNGVEIRNRLVVAPLTHWSSDADGHATPGELQYIKARSKGFGMFVSAAIAVCREGIAFTGQPVAFSEDDLHSLSQVAAAIRQGGALAIAQLQHGGAAALLERNGGVAYAPSRLDQQTIDTIGKNLTVEAHEMTQEDIRHTVAAFANACELALRAGFDGVELHGANGYLLQQFFSAKTNRRADEYGGSVENRIRFAMELTDAVNAIKKKYNRPDFILGYRITPEEPREQGLTMTDTLALVDALAEKGVQYVHLSLQDFHSKPRRGADVSKSRLQVVKERLEGRGVALIGVGKLATPQKALEAMNTDTADFVAIGLGVILNPNFVELIETGRETKVRTMPNIFRNAAYHQLPEPMWNMILGFAPKWAVTCGNIIGKILGWK